QQTEVIGLLANKYIDSENLLNLPDDWLAINNIGNAETENPRIITENRHMKIMSYSTEQYIFHEKKKLQIEILAHAVMSYKKIMSYSTEQYIFHEKKETPNQNRNLSRLCLIAQNNIYSTQQQGQSDENLCMGGQPEIFPHMHFIVSDHHVQTGDFLAVRFLLRYITNKYT
ncbi:hypothetical protein ACJX0J_028046, partial [Zea mays]